MVPLTRQDKIGYLRQYQELEEEYQWLKEQKVRWSEIASRITPSMTGMPKGRAGNKIQTAAVHIADLTDQIDKNTLKIIEKLEEISDVISSVPDAQQRKILRQHYIEGMRIGEIARISYRDYSWIAKIHKKALDSIPEEAIKSQKKPQKATKNI